jgi:hypothetical protein
MIIARKTGFQISLTTTYIIDIEYSNGIVKKGYVNIDVDKDYIYIFIIKEMVEGQ